MVSCAAARSCGARLFLEDAVSTGDPCGSSAGAAARPAARRGDVVLETALLLVSGVALVRLLARGLLPVPLAWPAPWGWSLHLALVFLLLAWRVRRAGRTGERSSRRWGGWLAGWRGPELALAAALLFALRVLSPPIGMLGADAAIYLQQLRDVLLRGELRTWTGVEPGTVIVWAPFFLIGHALAQLGLGRDLASAPEGLSHAYRAAMAVSGPVYGFLCVLFTYRVCRRFFPSLLAACCASGAWLASSLYHYSVAEPIMPHAPGAALVSLLLLLWIRAREAPERRGRWLAAATAAGLVISIQRYNVYFLLPLVWDGVAVVRRHWRVAADRRALLARAVALSAFFSLGVVPLLLLAISKPAGGLLSPDHMRAFVGDWSRPHVFEILYSSNGGLFVWTPWALLAVPGLILFARLRRQLGAILLVTLACGIYLLATSPQWTGGWSFGSRRLTEAFPVLVLGFCALADALLRRPWVLGLGALAVLATVNVSMSRLVEEGRVPLGRTVRFVDAGRDAVESFYTTLGHPPAWPWNWLFAAQHGVSPDRFDDLHGRSASARVHLLPGSDEARTALASGWTLLREPRPALWATAREARILVRLAPSSGNWRVRGRAAAAPDPNGRRQSIDVAVNGRFAGRVMLDAVPASWSVVVPAAWWKDGLNDIRFEANWTLPRGRGAAQDGVPHFAAWRLDELAVDPTDPTEP